MMKPGRYTAKVIEAGVGQDKNNEPQPFMKLQTEAGETITWYGSLKSEKAQEIAVKAAVTAGFTGRDWDDFSRGVSSFKTVSVSITVEDETYNGKTRTKVKWINPIKTMDYMSAAEVKAKVSSASLFAQIRSENKPSKPSTEDVPF
jgi:hypothetical protein